MSAAGQAPPALVAVRLLQAFLLFAIGPELATQALVRSGWWPEPTSWQAQVELGFLGFGLAGLGVLAFACWQPAGPWRPWRPALVVGSYLPLLAVWVPFLYGYLQLAHAWGQTVPRQPGLEYLARVAPTEPGFAVVVAATALVAPVAEEILFRGYLRDLVRTRLGPWPTNVLVAAVFGLLHGLGYALPIALLGLWFGWLRERTGSLLPGMLGHALHNLVGVVVTAGWPPFLDLFYPR